MVADPEIIQAVPGTKNKASTYNTNFANMVQYVKDSMATTSEDVAETLSLYQEVNTLSTQGTIALTSNTINAITPDGDVTFTLPTITGEDTGKYHQILVQVYMPETIYTIEEGTTFYFDGIKPAYYDTGSYDIIYVYDNIRALWCCSAIYKGVVSE